MPRVSSTQISFLVSISIFSSHHHHHHHHSSKMATVKAIPPGGTFIDTLDKSFVDVPVNKEKDNAIATTEFLQAAESLTTLFDVMGSVAFNPVKNDIGGNIKKLRERQLAAPAESETLQDLFGWFAVSTSPASHSPKTWQHRPTSSPFHSVMPMERPSSPTTPSW
ncbi:hypothetical protein EYC80_002075 [Monilinia laxa]|uniref:Glycolipid transfer protein domain-containing protein n=1 Tax=Monilinia laxa TaxID=61186 RepID=A0A5N6K6Z5_MONLA|nr:hypothetical protein EYC80_002075 [Monilinia laxa]